ncbi:MAG: hypothetical protein AB3N10_15135, partial [Allomuricauda sp.]
MKTCFPLLLLALLVSCQESGPKKQYTSKTYQVFMRDNLAGSHTSSMDSHGNYVYTFEFNDRGRGPEILEKIRLDKAGNISYLEITGVNYLKDTVAETYSYLNGS